MFVYILNINSQELGPKSFVWVRMKIRSFPKSITYHTREFQITSNYTRRLILYALNFLLNKNGESHMSDTGVVHLRRYKYSHRNLEMSEH